MRKILSIVGIILIAILGGFFYYQHSETERHTFKVWFLNIGQGDSSLIQFTNGQTMLVDCGKDKRVLFELGQVIPFYIHTIDYVIATHPDLDHYGGCVDVLKRYDVKHVITNGKEKNYDGYWREWDKTMHAEGAEIITMASPTTWTISSDTLQFFSPDSSLTLDVKADDANNYSIVFKLSHKSETFLFTGDMEMPLEEAIINKYCVSSSVILSPRPSRSGTKNLSQRSLRSFAPTQDDKMSLHSCPTLQSGTLKVGHHGSPGSSGQDFVNAVRPKTAVISVGQNRYGHPSLRVIRHLERVGADILRTDQHGAILVQ